jgi:hypothetical protein
MATESKSTSKATTKAAPKRTTKAAAKDDTASSKDGSGDAKQTDTTTKSTAAKNTGKNGYVVEELDNGLVSVAPTDSADFGELAGKLISSADSPEEVETRSMPRRFVVPADLAKKAGVL